MYLAFRVITTFDYENSSTSVVYLGCGTESECKHTADMDSTYWPRLSYGTDPKPRSSEEKDVYKAYETSHHNYDGDTIYSNIIYLVVDSTKSMTSLVRDWM